jgi:hypothetical protein
VPAPRTPLPTQELERQASLSEWLSSCSGSESSFCTSCPQDVAASDGPVYQQVGVPARAAIASAMAAR